MWRCGACGEQNEEQFDVCWKCQQPGGQVDSDETQFDLLFDPERPQPVQDGQVQCPTCGQQFRVTKEESGTRVRRKQESAACPHCGHGVTPELLVRVAAVKREGTATQVREVIYACPYCGKVLSIAQQ